tara:strand:- start:948 stop:1106 length:159 start_codon:yes stop_codon:yes gene_type:complete
MTRQPYKYRIVNERFVELFNELVMLNEKDFTAKDCVYFLKLRKSILDKLKYK